MARRLNALARLMRTFPCRQCGAAVGAACVTSGGRQASSEHVDRLDQAIEQLGGARWLRTR